MKDPANDNGVHSIGNFVSDDTKLKNNFPGTTNNVKIPKTIKPNFDFDSVGINKHLLQEEADRLSSLATTSSDTASVPFPIEVFPLVIQQIIKATNETLNFPIDFIGASLLFSVSVATGNTHKVEVKKGWLESPVVYIAIVAHAGANKSHPLNFALQPLIEQDKKTFRQYEQQKKEFDISINLSKKERKQQGVDEPITPVCKKLLLSDYTPEALAEVHKANRRGLGVYVDELAGWFKNFNRYNKGSEMELWLSIWSCMLMNIVRKNGEPIHIPMPFISVCGTIQNGILHELAKGNRAQNGFIDRILFVFPDNIQKEYWNEKELPLNITEKWHSIISNILKLPMNIQDTVNPIPEILKFSLDAKKILFEWQKENTDQINNTENDAIRGIYNKMEIHAVRLALILEMMSYACEESDKRSISVNSTEGALKLVSYFKNSALKVNSILSNVSPLDKYPSDKQKLYEALPERFTTESGLLIAKSMGVAERTFKYFLTTQELFKHTSRGEYQKLI
jgi:hypothetical protein